MSNALTRVMASAGEGFRRTFGWNTAHRGASRTSPDMAGWHASRGSADADLLTDLPELRYRARDIRRNNGLAASIANAYVDNIVGAGIRMCSQPDYMALGKTRDWADKWGEQWEGIFHEWFWSTACHAGDTKTGDMLAEECVLAKIDSGGSLTLPLWLPERGDGFATKLRTVEIDRLSNPNGAPDSKRMRNGVEFDAYGMPLAYNIRNGHPGDRWQDAESFTWERIPRRTDFGRLRVIHDFEGDRPDQTQGKPLFSPVLSEFKNIDRYRKAEIAAALQNANIWGAITTPLEPEQIVELFTGDRDKYLEARDKYAIEMRPGMLAALMPGDKLESFIPQRPNSQYGAFCKNVENIISFGAGIPWVLATRDFTESNYSNTRAATNELYRTVTRKRDRLGAGWLDPVSGLLLEECVNDGRIEAPGFYENRRAYQRCSWIGPPRGYVDLVKEATGNQILLDSYQITFQQIAAQQGMHWRELADQCAAERAYMAEKGLPDHSAIRAANPPQVAPPDEPVDENAPARQPKKPVDQGGAAAHA